MGMNDHPTAYNEAQKFGVPGKWSKVIQVSNTSASFTGSDFGMGGVIVAESGTTGHIDLWDGGRIDISKLQQNQLYEFAPKHMATNNKVVYVLKKNPKVS